MTKYSFEVNLENVELSKAQISQIQKDINSVVARNIIQDVKKETILGNKVKLNPEWLGIWLRKFNNLEDLRKDTDFKQFQFQEPKLQEPK